MLSSENRLSIAMSDSSKNTLKRLIGGNKDSRATTDELQGLLLQIVFALLMIFIIAYFIFVTETKKTEEAQVLDLNRQKLVLALEKTAENRRIRYGLNALMVQGTDGKRIFDADAHISKGRIDLAPAARTAFSTGSKAAFSDYADVSKLQEAWYDEVLKSAEIEKLSEPEVEWLKNEIAERVETVRLDARGVQRALAARLQSALIENPGELGAIKDAGALAEAIKAKSLDMVEKAIEAEVLP